MSLRQSKTEETPVIDSSISTTSHKKKFQQEFKIEQEGKPFVQQCDTCKKQIHDHQHAYMYNDRAFCYPGCRVKQMTLDMEFKCHQLTEKPKPT